MKALVYTGPRQLDFRDTEAPTLSGGDHLVRIDSVGICGSDMHAYLGHDARRPAPLILGHEAAGTIVGGPRDGERVTINPLVTCGTCRFCLSGRENLCLSREIISMPPRQGAFAQFVAMPDRNLIEVPDTVSLAQAALAEPLAVSWHAIRLGVTALGAHAQGAACLVIGGGAIGVAAALAARAMGIKAITLSEPNAQRRAYIAARVEATICAPEALMESPPFDLIIDAVGIAQTRRSASALAAPGGVILHIGLGDSNGGLDIRRMTLQEISFIGTYTYTAQDFRDTCAALYEGRLGALDWIETRPLSQGALAFDDIQAGRAAAPKIILDPNQTEKH